MKTLKQTITLDRSAREVFDFTLNPKNTPKWVDGVVAEQASDSPAKLGTIFKNQDRSGNWSEFEVTECQPGVLFAMSKRGSNVHIKYTFTPLGDDKCQLEYYVWVDTGEIDERFTEDVLKDILQKLKTVVEDEV